MSFSRLQLTGNIICNLPDTLLLEIYSYLQINVRIAILKNRYSKKCLKYKMNKIHIFHLRKLLLESIKIISKKDLYDYKFSVLNLTCIKHYNKSLALNYPEFYRKRFIDIIIYAIKHYVHVYKENKQNNLNDVQIVEYENSVFKLLAQIIKCNM